VLLEGTSVCEQCYGMVFVVAYGRGTMNVFYINLYIRGLGGSGARISSLPAGITTTGVCRCSRLDGGRLRWTDSNC